MSDVMAFLVPFVLIGTIFFAVASEHIRIARVHEARQRREAEAQRFHALERAAAVSIDDVIESAERRAEHPEWSWGWVNGLLVRHHHVGLLRDDPEPKSAANCHAANCPEKVR